MGDGPFQTAHWLSVTLYSIGDAVIATDAEARVTFMNPVAEALTGWTADDATGVDLDTVFVIVNEETRATVESPVAKALRDGVIIGLANHTVLIAKDGTERPIDDSAAPIRDEAGGVAGVVLVFRDISERKQHEQSLQDTLDYCTSILATLREPFLVFDRDLRVVSANREFYETFRADPETTEGCLIYELGDGQWDIPRLRDALDEVLSNDHPVLGFEVEHDFPDLGTKCMVLNARRIRKNGNHSELILLAIEDATARKESERDLQVSEQRYRRLFEAARDGILILDAETMRIEDANPFMCQLLGYTLEQFQGKELWEIGLFPDKQESQAAVETLREEGYVRYEDLPLETEGGQTREVEFICNVYREDHHDVAQCNIRDITDSKKSERALQVSEQRYRRLFESARDGILILDAGTMAIIDANPYMSELLGYSKEEFCEKQLWEIGLFPDKQESQAAVETLRKEGYVRYEDLPLETEGGYRREVEFVCNIYREDHHDVAQCNIRDITERKALERQIHAQAQALADANRRKDEFLAMLSHELRNPMAPMFNALHLMGRDGEENALHREARGVLNRQVRHLSRLTDDLLEISRVTTGRIRLHTERVDARGIVEQAVERVRPMMDRKKQTLSITLPEAPVWLDADATRLEQVVGNLLGNASKYSDEGRPIWLTAEQQDGHVTLRVRDDGIGLARDLLPHVFDLFTQGDKSLERTDGGLGIGLALVKSLVELHRGTVEARSDGLGRGSAFVVRLPVAHENGAEPEPSPSTAETMGALRVLVVEDSVDAARMSALLLRSWGHEVRVAHSGPEALERETGFHPQVVLLDIGLPGMDGYEVARRLRQTPQLEGVRLVAVTGYGQDTDRQRAMEAGFDVHLVKPVEVSALKDLLAGIQPPTT